MSRTRLVATLMCGLITIGILATPTGALASSSPQSATQVVQLGTANVVKTTNSEVSKTQVADSSVTVTPYPSQYGSLSNISNAFYGSPGYWPGLCQANGISNCNLIQVGQQIKVPTSAPQAPAQGSTAPVQQQAAAPAPQANSSAAQTVVNFALAQVGKPYVWGAAGPWSYDCSGLVAAAFAQVGISLPHNDQQILYSGKGYAVSRNNLQPGDVVWPYVGHVFIYIGNGRIVEAARPGVGVVTNNLYAFSTARRYV